MLRFPEIDPVLVSLGPLQIRWYAMFYIISFVVGYIFLKRLARRRDITMNADQYDNLLFHIMLGVILGGRFGYCLFYEPLHFLTHPWEIVWPFRNGQYHGIAGMSFHGGAIGVIIASLLYCRRHHFSFLRIGDAAAPLVAVGLGLGRIGNFINAELYGRVTASPLGMIFPEARKLTVIDPTTKEVMNGLGWQLSDNWTRLTDRAGNNLSDLLGPGGLTVNLPRHPSQLYEAFLEGLCLWAISYVLLRKLKEPGYAFWIFIGFYGIFRFVVEFFRQPDEHLNFVLGPLTMGQVLSTTMIVGSVIALMILHARSRRISTRSDA